MLLIHGARAVFYALTRKPPRAGWLTSLLARKDKNVAAVALANKNARIVRALLGAVAGRGKRADINLRSDIERLTGALMLLGYTK